MWLGLGTRVRSSGVAVVTTCSRYKYVWRYIRAAFVYDYVGAPYQKCMHTAPPPPPPPRHAISSPDPQNADNLAPPLDHTESVCCRRRRMCFERWSQTQTLYAFFPCAKCKHKREIYTYIIYMYMYIYLFVASPWWPCKCRTRRIYIFIYVDYTYAPVCRTKTKHV